MDQVPPVKTNNTHWKSLYKIGAWAAIIAVVIFRRNFGIELVQFQGFGIFDVPAELPNTASQWFDLLQSNTVVGLALLDVVDLINYALVGLMFLALCRTLRQVNRSAITTAIVLVLMGITVYFATNQAFGILSLSQQYTEANTDVQRSSLEASGEALLTINNHSTGYYLSLLLVKLGGLVFAIVMLRSNIFSKATAYVGLLANGIALVFFLGLVFPPLIYAIPIAAPFRVAWYLLIARRLLQLGRE